MAPIDLGMAYDTKGNLRYFLDFAYPDFRRRHRTTRASLGGKIEIFWVNGFSDLVPVLNVRRWPRGSSCDINLQKKLDLPADLYRMDQ